MKAERLHILSRDAEPFKDRRRAGRLLAGLLKEWAGKGVLVLGVPRGGMVIADEIARALKAQIDIVLAHKLGAPGNPELAIGAVGENGECYLNQGFVVMTGSDDQYIESEKKRQLAEIKRRLLIFRKQHPKVPRKDRVVILTDDGIATGATLKAALLSIRQERAKKIIVAMPVAPQETLEELSEEADSVICLQVPGYFTALSQFYSQFPQVSDEEVEDILCGKQG